MAPSSTTSASAVGVNTMVSFSLKVCGLLAHSVAMTELSFTFGRSSVTTERGSFTLDVVPAMSFFLSIV